MIVKDSRSNAYPACSFNSFVYDILMPCADEWHNQSVINMTELMDLFSSMNDDTFNHTKMRDLIEVVTIPSDHFAIVRG